MRRRIVEALRTIAALPEDGWGDAEWDAFIAARQVAVDEIGRIDRDAERKAARPAAAPIRSRRPVMSAAAACGVGERSRGVCEAATDACTGRAAHIHHIAGRGGPRPHRLENLLHVCRPCHDYIHAHPDESYLNGWMRKRNGVTA